MKRTERIMVFVLLYFFVTGMASKPMNMEKFKAENNIIMEADLNNDGRLEYIASIENIKNFKPLIYIQKGRKMIPVSADKGMELNKEVIALVLSKPAVFTNENGKTYIAYAFQLARVCKGRSSDSGSAVLIYELKNEKLINVKRYAYEIVFGDGECSPETAQYLTGYEDADFSKYGMGLVAGPDSKGLLIYPITSFDSFYLCEDDLSLRVLEIRIPIEIRSNIYPNSIKAYKIQNNVISLTFKNGKEETFQLSDKNSSDLTTNKEE